MADSLKDFGEMMAGLLGGCAPQKESKFRQVKTVDVSPDDMEQLKAKSIAINTLRAHVPGMVSALVRRIYEETAEIEADLTRAMIDKLGVDRTTIGERNRIRIDTAGNSITLEELISDDPTDTGQDSATVFAVNPAKVQVVH